MISVEFTDWWRAKGIFGMKAAFTVLLVLLSVPGSAQDVQLPQPAPRSYTAANAEQVAKILGLGDLLQQLQRMRAQSCVPAGAEELVLRQEFVEAAVASGFEIDGVLAELNNEQARLAEISSRLQGRRDHSVNLLNVANLVTGTGVGVAVNALQFSNATSNFGNGLGVGSGIASTALSLIGIRVQRGPQRSVGRVPNMLAPLFGKPAELNASYPRQVMNYLNSIPADDANQRSRLQSLMTEWDESGRIGPADPAKRERKILGLTSSMDNKTRLSIDDISDRISMLADVAGTVGLMKRDIGELMRSLRTMGSCSVR